MKSGVININKEKGWTSMDVVAKVRRVLGEKKVGHTGTLDPDATGVLPVCICKATKLCDMLTDKDKVYEAVLLLGISTDTEDITGEVIAEKQVDVSEDRVMEVIRSFVGEYDQVPPMYSAIKINGQKLCDLARKGREVKREPRRVNIIDITVHEMALPRVTMEVHCSKGTYIRSLCRDIGDALGVGGCMESLVRTKVERFTLENAVTIKELEEHVEKGTVEEIFIPLDQMFSQLKEIRILPDKRKLGENGNVLAENEILPITDKAEDDERVRVYDDLDRFIGIYKYKKNRREFSPVKIFLE